MQHLQNLLDAGRSNRQLHHLIITSDGNYLPRGLSIIGLLTHFMECLLRFMILQHKTVIFFCRYLTILPSIHLSIVVSPEVAISIRHPSETSTEEINPPQHSQSWDPSGQFTIEPNQSSSLIQRLVSAKYMC